MAAPGLAVRKRIVDGNAFRFLDLGLLGAVYGIQLLGLLMIYSSSRARLRQQGLSPFYFVERQAVAVVLGTVVMVLVLSIDYRKFRDWSVFAYIAAVAPLVLVLSPLGARSKGTQGWFPLPGGFQLQPGEFAKFFLAIALAGFAYQFVADFDVRRLATYLVLAGFPIGLVLLQPDLGTAMVMGVIAIAILAAAGVKARYLAVLAAVAVIAVVAVLQLGILQRYQVDRLTSFLNQGTKNVQGAAYNQDQSKTAIGNGGLTGRGLFGGSQTEGGYVPEQHTDFIFTAVGEELGFFGAATVLALFGIVVWRMWRSAVLAADPFGTLVCVGMLAMFMFHVFENIGMSMGIMPVTGIPLPFMSYGGTSTIVFFACVGMVLNVQMRRFS